MSDTNVVLTLQKQSRATAKLEGTRVTFSPHQCFVFDNRQDEIECLRALGNYSADIARTCAGRLPTDIW